MQKLAKGKFTMQSNSGMSFILPVRTAFPVSRTSLTPDDSYRRESDFQHLRRRDTHCLSALAPGTTHLLLLGTSHSHRWHLLGTKSSPSVSRAGRNKAGELCQPTEDLALLWILSQLYIGSTKCFKRKSGIIGWALEGAGTSAITNLITRSHLNSIFSQTM